MSTTRPLHAAILVLTLLAGCTREATLQGDVFVVAKGGQNFKLGLVEVRLIPDVDSAGKIAVVMQGARKKVETLRSEEALSASMLRLKSVGLDRDLSGQYDALLARARDLNAAFYADLKLKKRQQLESRLKSLETAQAEQEKLHILRLGIRSIESGYDLVAELPVSTFTAKTDADGKFTIRVPRGRYLAVASAKREVGGEPEFYAWAVSVDLSQAPEVRLMLSNDNLIESSCRNCPVPITELAAALSPAPKLESKQLPSS